MNFQILDDLNPPTKLLGRFIRTWGDHEKTRAQFSQRDPTSSTLDAGDATEIALSLSRRLIAVSKVKSILHIESGLEMVALAMVISAEVRNF